MLRKIFPGFLSNKVEGVRVRECSYCVRGANRLNARTNRSKKLEYMYEVSMILLSVY